ncbi:MAG TPA: carbamoyltransferase C-terminal domain-containing protein [Candidatus Acidoferrales bacterium]|jgi:carbamoyltransferase|nr:carbamoyltransferase C-terminal domain-containing protein [Candidatus Acidoferrales bacterium]
MFILGINAYHGNASAAILADGRLIAAVEEERFNRVKYAAGFPAAAIRYCLDAAGITIKDVDHIAIPRDPRARLGTKLFYSLRMPSFAFERMKVMGRFAGIPETLAKAFDISPNEIRGRYHRIEHHQAHLASAFFVSPFEQAALLSADGLGDFASTMWGTGLGNCMRIDGAIAFPHSLGMYYTAVSQYLGFRKFGDEYKVMGLGAYGEPAYLDEFRQIVFPTRGVGFRLGLKYFKHHRTGPEMTWRDAGKTPELGAMFSDYMAERLGPARDPTAPVEKVHRDVAATLQARLEEVLFDMLRALHDRTKQTAVCLAGGVAFNCIANGKIFDKTPFEKIFVQPAAGDAGLALGAAYFVHNQVLGLPRCFVMEDAYWGPGYSQGQIRSAVAASRLQGAGLEISELPETVVAKEAAREIAAGKILGWFQGRAEWGPRALGNRSIVADPRRPDMKDILNARIKHREMFRPFAPSILAEATGEYFEKSYPCPFMTQAYSVRPEKREAIPAPTHVDGSGRLQTVTREANPRYWGLIREFANLTGVPVVLNTSFNDNEPIVCRPEEAIECFLRTKMDVLVLGDTLVRKPESAEVPR